MPSFQHHKKISFPVLWNSIVSGIQNGMIHRITSLLKNLINTIFRIPVILGNDSLYILNENDTRLINIDKFHKLEKQPISRVIQLFLPTICRGKPLTRRASDDDINITRLTKSINDIFFAHLQQITTDSLGVIKIASIRIDCGLIEIDAADDTIPSQLESLTQPSTTAKQIYNIMQCSFLIPL